MKAIYFKVSNNIVKEINEYLDKGWTVESITPRLEARYVTTNAGASETIGYLVIFRT